MSRYCFPVVLWLSLVWCGVAPAAEDEPAALQKIVVESAEKYAQAFADRDAKAMAAMFTVEAEYVDSDGVVFHGRGAIEAEYVAQFAAGAAGKVEIELVSIRPIAPGILTEEGISTFIPKEQGVATRTRYTATHVKQADGKWLLASIRELAAPEVATHDRLQALAWLEGKWHEDSESEVVSTEWKWSEDGNFLMSKFSVEGVNNTTLQGTHRIGWDAERKQFRSWVFDSSGGFAEGFWTHEEDGSWSVLLSGVDAGGVRFSGRLNYAGGGSEALVVTQDQRSRAGVGLAGFSRRIVREPPVPGTKAAAPVKKEENAGQSSTPVAPKKPVATKPSTPAKPPVKTDKK